MKNTDVVIFTDFQEGHLFPLFDFANILQNQGCQVCFVGIIDSLKTIERSGFNFFPVLEDLFPKGYVDEVRLNKKRNYSVLAEFSKLSFTEIERVINVLNPRLIFWSSFFSLEALIVHHKYGIKQAIFHTLLRPLGFDTSISYGEFSSMLCIKRLSRLSPNLSMLYIDFFDKLNLPFHSFEELAFPLKEMQQIMLFPKELEIQQFPEFYNETYIGPGINVSKNFNTSTFLSSLGNSQKDRLIYASIGSQGFRFRRKAEKIFNCLLEAMKSSILRDFHLVLSLGSSQRNWKLGEVPPNVSVCDWVPQIEVLQNVSLAITHGGLGSIKECFYFGVPMLIIPIVNDQMDNAQRIKSLGIGHTLNISNLKTELLASKIFQLSKDGQVLNNLESLKKDLIDSNYSEVKFKLAKSMLK